MYSLTNNNNEETGGEKRVSKNILIDNDMIEFKRKKNLRKNSFKEDIILIEIS